MRPAKRDERFTVPLYTLAEASTYLRVPQTTLRTWADGYEQRRHDRTEERTVSGLPIITSIKASQRGHARLPFIGIAEAYVLNAFRRSGVPMQRIRPSLDWLVQHVGPHALASKDLYTDGAEVLWQFAQQTGEDSPDGSVARHLIVPRSGQYVFKDVVKHYLKQISFSDDNYANLIRLPQFEHANVVLDPQRGRGQPVFGNSGVRVSDALGPLHAGESFDAVSEDYGVPVGELRDALELSA
ncbi:DUF433 domain-containing protein [Lapillicoccus jejuensis]|uniref:Uncharacterized protein (DUF433 family) n=1 Tax=Lapillicoccus jejuensis TaxID=402171 RepID=A0A542E0E4_9MICO|nr:uncharacterized protein (DUF433 family) [Lapillicoccus jejuensis]